MGRLMVMSFYTFLWWLEYFLFYRVYLYITIFKVVALTWDKSQVFKLTRLFQKRAGKDQPTRFTTTLTKWLQATILGTNEWWIIQHLLKYYIVLCDDCKAKVSPACPNSIFITLTQF